MASRRAAFAPLSVFRTSVDFDFGSDSSSLHAGQRLAKPGFPGFNSNSSEHTAQTLIGNPMSNILTIPLEITESHNSVIQAEPLARKPKLRARYFPINVSWLAAHSHAPLSCTQVSVKRPRRT
jgi:hypothetical protein